LGIPWGQPRQETKSFCAPLPPLSTHARESTLPSKSRSLTSILESCDWFRDGNKG
jgi:hypothetical protein